MTDIHRTCGRFGLYEVNGMYISVSKSRLPPRGFIVHSTGALPSNRTCGEVEPAPQVSGAVLAPVQHEFRNSFDQFTDLGLVDVLISHTVHLGAVPFTTTEVFSGMY
jgi:hypothetical protein